MTSPDERDSEVDRLYQLPLDQFVTARTELARRLGRDKAPAVRSLAKPNLLAWALNQLYWSKRNIFDRLVAAAARLRAAQAEALRGKQADLRVVGEEHRTVIREALRETSEILETSGHPVTPDAVRELTGAFEALPWNDRPGRLVRPPVSSGFGVLAGLPIAAPSRRAAVKAAEAATQPHPPLRAAPATPRTGKAKSPGFADVSREAAKRRDAELKAARAAVAAANREQMQATSRLRREEKQLEVAKDRAGTARQALADAERELARAEEARVAAASSVESARKAAAEATARLDHLRRSGRQNRAR